MSSVRYHRPVVRVFAEAASGNLVLPEGWLLQELTITLTAVGGAVVLSSTVTSTGLGGLSFKMAGALVENAVDRLYWRPNEPLKIDVVTGAGVPQVTFPSVENGTWHCVALVRPE